LAKEFNDELIEKETVLLAGKDKNGQPIKFRTLENWKVTRAQVAEIRNTCIAPDFINASTISEAGAPPAGAFRAFGDDDTAPSGSLGFALCSPQLYLLEGQRNIDINLELEGKIEDANELPAIVKVEYSTGDGFHPLQKLLIDDSGTANGFVLRSLLSPFSPLQTVEPVRRIVNDILSDLCEFLPPIPTPTPNDEAVVYIHARLGAHPHVIKFLQDYLFYPALSGIYSIHRYIREADQAALTDPGKALDDKFKAQLLFYRAYYHWSLATTFLPAYDGNGSMITSIPNLENWQPGNTPLDNFTQGDLYDSIVNDLDEAADLLDTTEGKDTSSKTSINYYTVQAFLSKVHLYLQNWSDCAAACDEVLGFAGYSLNGDEYTEATPGDAFRSDNYEERLRKTFEDINGSSEVIWALEAAQGGLDESLFSYLGLNDSFGRKSRKRFFGESALLDDLYKKTWEDLPANLHPQKPGTWSAQEWTDYQAAFLEEWDKHNYDFRDTHYFGFDEKLGAADTVDPGDDETYSGKYFQQGQTQVVMLRLAEVYLNKAACMMLKNSPNKSVARALVNQLRYRAGALPYLDEAPGAGVQTPITINDTLNSVVLNATLDNYYALPDADFNLEIIENERMRELCFEGDRKDFVRTAQRTNLVRMENIDVRGGAVWSDDKLYFLNTPPSVLNADEKARITAGERRSTLNLNITLKEDAPPMVSDNHLREQGIAVNPLLRVTFEGNDKVDKGQGSRFYNFLKKQNVTHVSIGVDVKGIRKNLVIQNDFGQFTGIERFFPFGPLPENSSNSFLGCEEAFNKKISSATVTFDWVEDKKIVDGEIGYDDVYKYYDEAGGVPNPAVRVELLKNATFSETAVLNNEPMFETVNGKKRMRAVYKFNVLAFDRVAFGEEVVRYEQGQKRGFLRFRLLGDFGHKSYPKLLTKRALEAAAGDTTAKDKLPSEPYTPSSNGISLDYVSLQVMEKAFDQFFHVLPFKEGLHAADIYQTETPVSLVYPYDSPAGEPENIGYYPANLFLGLENHQPGDNLALLFQTSEGSERNFEKLPPKIHWMYLVGNEWQPIPVQQILRDTTRGLTRSGMLQLAIPADISSQGNTMLNPALLWLRAAVVESPLYTVFALPSLLDIRAQAVEAIFVPEKQSDLLRLDDPLAPQTISKLEISRSAVKKVEQPHATFGGRKPETDASEYYRRVSERLRHKDRAVTAWDYEHLLLEQYNTVAIAKCISHTRYEVSGAYVVPSELAPGFVSVAVIPDLQRRPNMVREQPRFSRGDLYEMRDFLLPKTNLFLQPIPALNDADEEDHFLQVVNPQYEPLHVALSVWLRRGADQNLAIYQINEALRRHIAPWLYDAGKGPTFGREIRRSDLIRLVESQESVDVVRWLKIFQVVLPPGIAYPVPSNEENLLVIDQNPLDSSNPPVVVADEHWKPYEVTDTVARPHTARSILTTAPAHQILIMGGKGANVIREEDGTPAPPPVPIPPVAPRRVKAPPPEPTVLETWVAEPPAAAQKKGKKATKSSK
ncbi:MAG: RagB/SusD family nutrient uptake outer membrane protein, partial [Saprospiraceae bacterium]|nr:RagB/SusD family nutrient uptake outer membrane protein [Saprospiraceae bacterium]